MEIIYIICALAWSILCLILFFKIWGMTNDIKDIKNFLYDYKNEPSSTNATFNNNILEEEPEDDTDISELVPGTKVIHKTLDKVLIIDSINNNGEAALCKNESGEIVATYHLKNLKKIK